MKAAQSFNMLLARLYTNEFEQMAFREVLAIPTGEVLLGADRWSRRHLLVPVEDGYALSPVDGESIEVAEFIHPETDRRYLDLVCKVEPLGAVFATLVDDLMGAIADEPAKAPALVLTGLSDWRKLLKSASSIADSQARGLFGELVILRQLAAKNAVFAVDSWLGPSGSLHDFVTPHVELEVKASSREGNDVVITSLGQLDAPQGGADLVLVRVALDASPNGQSIGEVFEELVAMGCDRNLLADRLADAGFLLGHTNDDHRFQVKDQAAWRVTDEFPGLRSTDIVEARREAITRVSYTLDLGNANGRLEDEDLDEIFVRMVTAE